MKNSETKVTSTGLNNWSGIYLTNTTNEGGYFGSMIINDDSSIEIAGVAFPYKFDADKNVLTFTSVKIKKDTVSAKVTFDRDPSGNMVFAGTLTIEANGKAENFTGSEIVDIPPASLQNAVNINEMFTTGDKVTISGSNDMFMTIKDGGFLVCDASKEEAFEFTIEKSGDYVHLSNASGAYVSLNTDDMYGNDFPKSEAANFLILLNLNGTVVLSTKERSLCILNPSSKIIPNSISSTGSKTLSQLLEFSIHVTNPVALSISRPVGVAPDLSPCEIATGSLAFHVTGGLFLALGIGPILSDGEVRTGIVGLLRSNPVAWSYVQQIVVLAGTNKKKTVAAIAGLVGALYHQGLLWSVMKLILSTAKWFVIGEILAKVIEIAIIPQAEAVELISSMSVWYIQLGIYVKDYKDVCGNSVS